MQKGKIRLRQIVTSSDPGLGVRGEGFRIFSAAKTRCWEGGTEHRQSLKKNPSAPTLAREGRGKAILRPFQSGALQTSIEITRMGESS